MKKSKIITKVQLVAIIILILCLLEEGIAGIEGFAVGLFIGLMWNLIFSLYLFLKDE